MYGLAFINAIFSVVALIEKSRQALPDDLKTKLSLDEDCASSPKEALSRASAERAAARTKHLRRYISHSV